MLDMFACEVRFYREIAPVVGVRVPACFAAEDTADGTRLVLEDLSAWSPGGDPVVVAGLLAGMHARWETEAPRRWLWLRQPGAAADLVGDLFDRTWPPLAARDDLTPAVRAMGESLIGRVAAAEHAEGDAAPLTLCHGDASLRNLFTSPEGEVALVDWEDVRCAAGVADLAWLLVSSVAPPDWTRVSDAYGTTDGLLHVLPAAAAQGLLTLADLPVGHPSSQRWLARLTAAAERLGHTSR